MFDEENYQEPDLIEMTDEDGNTITMQVLDYFFYNGEEMEEFVPIEDLELEARLIEVASTQMNDTEDEEE